MLTVPIALIVLGMTAFAPAPTLISHWANGGPGKWLPAVSRASLPAPAVRVPVAVAGAVVRGGERARSRAPRAVGRSRVER
ncbi:MAG TPA: hypothetical protein VEF89_22635, partial [Solirubrobacteraceae bacterium]|nr:hypothetical protein [Solirubrobacteraceae bacterium]